MQWWWECHHFFCARQHAFSRQMSVRHTTQTLKNLTSRLWVTRPWRPWTTHLTMVSETSTEARLRSTAETARSSRMAKVRVSHASSKIGNNSVECYTWTSVRKLFPVSASDKCIDCGRTAHARCQSNVANDNNVWWCVKTKTTQTNGPDAGVQMLVCSRCKQWQRRTALHNYAVKPLDAREAVKICISVDSVSRQVTNNQTFRCRKLVRWRDRRIYNKNIILKFPTYTAYFYVTYAEIHSV